VSIASSIYVMGIWALILSISFLAFALVLPRRDVDPHLIISTVGGFMLLSIFAFCCFQMAALAR
jgi:drug/metabolite transporter (DMT)-like permease